VYEALRMFARCSGEFIRPSTVTLTVAITLLPATMFSPGVNPSLRVVYPALRMRVRASTPLGVTWPK